MYSFHISSMCNLMWNDDLSWASVWYSHLNYPECTARKNVNYLLPRSLVFIVTCDSPCLSHTITIILLVSHPGKVNGSLTLPLIPYVNKHFQLNSMHSKHFICTHNFISYDYHGTDLRKYI